MGQPPRNKPTIRQVPVKSSSSSQSSQSSGASTPSPSAGSGGNIAQSKMTGSGAGSGATGDTGTKSPSSSSAANTISGSSSRSGSSAPSSARNNPPGGSPRYTGPAGGSGAGARSGGGSRSSGGSARSNTGYDSYGRGGGRGDYGGRYNDYGPPPPRNYRNVRPRNVQPQRDPFPYIMGGVIGALVVGLMLVVFLLLNNKNSAVPGIPGNSGNAAPVDTSVAAGAATAAGDTPPRMPMDQFKALYDDPAKRPLIIDVRALDTFNAGHITGAESFPEADVDTRVSELPKDKLIVAYCQ